MCTRTEDNKQQTEPGVSSPRAFVDSESASRNISKDPVPTGTRGIVARGDSLYECIEVSIGDAVNTIVRPIDHRGRSRGKSKIKTRPYREVVQDLL